MLNICSGSGMVNIDGKNISYANIAKMYKAGDGVGIQLSEELEPNKNEIMSKCNDIAELVYELESMVNKGEEL